MPDSILGAEYGKLTDLTVSLEEGPLSEGEPGTLHPEAGLLPSEGSGPRTSLLLGLLQTSLYCLIPRQFSQKCDSLGSIPAASGFAHRGGSSFLPLVLQIILIWATSGEVPRWAHIRTHGTEHTAPSCSLRGAPAHLLC